jgi:uncharacterized membrane protein SpoIIM required for sporulation/uncharacterized RDD family membrane protein YckC
LVVTAERVPLSVPLAGVGERAIASFVDFMLVIFLAVAVLFLYTFVGRGDLEADLGQATATVGILAVAAVLTVIILYDVIGDVLFAGRTPGKRLARLRVVDSQGRPPDGMTSLLRNMMRLVDMLPIGYGVGVITMFVTGTRRLGDVVAGTVVISERARRPSVMMLVDAIVEGIAVSGDDVGVDRGAAIADAYAGDVDDDDVVAVAQTLLRTEGLEAALAERSCARVLASLEARRGRPLRLSTTTATAKVSSRATLAAALYASARAEHGLAFRLRRIADAEGTLRDALLALHQKRPPADAAERVDFALRHASSELMAATRRGVPARFLESISLTLLDTERARRVPELPLFTVAKRFFAHEVPAAVWRERRGIGRAAAIFGVSSVLGFFLSFVDAGVGRALVGDDLTNLVEQGARWTDQIEADGQHAAFSLRIIFNNVGVGVRLFALGILGGVASVMGLAFNGVSLGATFGMAFRLDTHHTLARFIVAHGPVELAMVCVAGAAGFCLGRAVLSPGERTRIEALRHEGRTGFCLLVFAVTGFVVIGTVEGFVSPGVHFSSAGNAAVGVAMFMLFVGWARLGRISATA